MFKSLKQIVLTEGILYYNYLQVLYKYRHIDIYH